jgi:hypothetical protein
MALARDGVVVTENDNEVEIYITVNYASKWVTLCYNSSLTSLSILSVTE